jgi:DNA (cytosine-5)-methyltransferase 1
MRYLSVCSGIEAATVAWHPLGWQAAAYSEIEAAPRAILSHHYPDTPLHGDFTTIRGDEYGPIDLLVGGTPCQSFSIAGLRGGLADDRGNLALEYLRLADRCGARWLVWENVPGVLSIDGGRAFGAILGGMAELGYGFAYRILDAQFFGVPQRRRRVFVVGYLGDWRRAVAVLFERHSLSGHPAPRREKGQVAPTVPSRSTGGGGLGTDFDCDGGLIEGYCPGVSPALKARDYKGPSSDGDGDGAPLIAHALRAEGFDASEDGMGRGTPLVPVAIQGTCINRHDGAGPKGSGFDDSGAMFTLTKADQHAVAFSIMPMNSGKDFKARETDVAQPIMAGGPVGGNQGGDYIVPFDTTQITSAAHYSNPKPGDPCHPLAAGAHPPAVRRLTPTECLRLQGFPDNYFDGVMLRGKPLADGPRYKALGNSMAVPVMRWIGERIALVEARKTMREAA